MSGICDSGIAAGVRLQLTQDQFVRREDQVRGCSLFPNHFLCWAFLQLIQRIVDMWCLSTWKEHMMQFESIVMILSVGFRTVLTEQINCVSRLGVVCRRI